MDWDQLATISQLVTGVATLAVAVFLWNQLKVQHRDSERAFAFANETKQQDLLASFTRTNRPLTFCGRLLIVMNR
jgi:hypothetical protein